MKGLLMKDFRLLAGQRRFYIIVIFVGIMTLVSGMDPSFFGGYITFLFAMLSLTTLTYDEYENGMQYLLTLPVTEKIYIQEKFLLSIGNSFFACVVGALIYLGISLAMGTVLASEAVNILMICFAELLVVLIMLSLTIPFVIKFGAERGRIALISVVVVISLIGVAVKTVLERLGMKEAILAFIDTNSAMVFVVFAVLVFLGLVVSYGISVKILGKKEF